MIGGASFFMPNAISVCGIQLKTGLATGSNGAGLACFSVTTLAMAGMFTEYWVIGIGGGLIAWGLLGWSFEPVND